jgi:hypothetical protein
MSAIDNAIVARILNALTPTGAAGIPGTAFGTIGAGAMKLRLTSTVPTEVAAGTELTNGTGYTTGGLAFSTASTVSSGSPSSAVTMPATTALSWTSSGSNFNTINGLEITDSVPIRIWYGTWNGAPISVASGNSFQVAPAAVAISLT